MRRLLGYFVGMKPLARFFHPLCLASSLGKKPRRVTVANEHYALFRDLQGQPAALLDRCPHRFAPLSAGRIRPDGRLACPYHGWHFDREGHGKSPSQPNLTRCDTPALQVVEKYGFLWGAAPGVSLDNLPNYGWDGFSLAGGFSTRFRAPLHVSFDNFSEDEHTPFVHTRLGWEEKDCASIEFEAKNFDDRTEVHYRAPQRRSQFLRLVGLSPGDWFRNDWVTRFAPVHSVYQISWTDPEGSVTRPIRVNIAIYMVPETETITLFHVLVWSRFDAQNLLQRAISSIVPPLAKWLTWGEVWDDARFIPTVAETPFSLRGMRLGRFDKPIVHNHKLLRSLYWGDFAEES
jgi:phenylpropionate dioxygenase-like ring-hydroxylating dioxygenase large terminal subunit